MVVNKTQEDVTKLLQRNRGADPIDEEDTADESESEEASDEEETAMTRELVDVARTRITTRATSQTPISS